MGDLSRLINHPIVNHPIWDFFDAYDSGNSRRRNQNSNSREVATSDVLGPQGWITSATIFSPPVDFYDKPDSYVVEATVAGARPSDIKVDYDSRNQELSISGEVSSSNTDDYSDDETEEDYRRRYLRVNERRYGSFERRIRVPNDQDIDADNISAEVRHGVLRIVVPKKTATEHKKRSVEVTFAEDD